MTGRNQQRRQVFLERLQAAALFCLMVLGMCGHAGAGPLPLDIHRRVLDEGAMSAMAAQGDLLLVGGGTTLLVLRVTPDGDIVRVGKVATGGEVFSVYPQGDYVYLATTNAGMTIVDLRNPSAPRVVGQAATSSRLRDVHVEGNLAYLASIDSGLDIYDVSDPLAPQFVSHYETRVPNDDGTQLVSVCVNRGRAYLGQNAYITILNVENPEAPFLVTQTDSPGWEIEIHDTIAYVTTNRSRSLRTYSVADPDTLIYLDGFGLTQNSGAAALNFAIDNGRAYVACEQAGLVAVNVSNPRDLRYAGTFDPVEVEPDAWDVAIVDTTAYFVSFAHGVFSVDSVSNPTVNATLRYEAASSPIRMASEGARLFVANYYDGLTEVNISNIDRPMKQWNSRSHGQFAYTTGVCTFRRDGRLYALTCDNDAGVRTIDMSDELHPEVMDSETQNLVGSQAAVVVGDYAYVCVGGNVVVLDISTVANIEYVTRIAAGGIPVNIKAEGSYVYVACHAGGLKILDISTPASPVSVWNYSAGAVYDVDVVYPRAYLAGPDSGVVVMDISNLPPVELGQYRIGHKPASIDVVDELAFVAAEWGGLRVLNIVNPSAIFEVAFRDSIGYGGNVHVSTHTTPYETFRTASVSMQYGGLLLFDVTTLYDTTRTSLIVAGGGNEPGNFEYFMANTNSSANFAHAVVSGARNYGHRVTYASPQEWQDTDGDGRDNQIVTSATMTAEGLRAAILRLQDSHNPNKPNVFYFTGHGHYNAIDINGNPADNVSADTLGAWLDQAELDDSTKLVIVIEACNAGSLIEELSVGHPNRIFIASGGAEETSRFAGGVSFTTLFWEYVWGGASVYAAFHRADTTLLSMSDFDQHPELDADGDGNPNEYEDDLVAADSVFIGGRISDGATLPVILDSPVGVDAFGDTLTVEIRCNDVIDEVWYRIYSFSGDEIPQGLQWGDMQPLGGEWYRARLTGLSALATNTPYVIEFNARDDYVTLAASKIALLRVNGPDSLPPLPGSLELMGYPNPFNSHIRIAYQTTVQGRVALDVWNILGQRVATLVDEVQDTGLHVVNWPGETQSELRCRRGCTSRG